MTREFRNHLSNGETIQEIAPEALAVCAEAARRTLRHPLTGEPMEPTREQLQAALALVEEPAAVEQLGGEGKSLSLALADYVLALPGHGVHTHTANNALARRDAEGFQPMYTQLGISVGLLEPTHGYDLNALPDRRRVAAYACDITYGYSDEFIFDFLKDELLPPFARRQRQNLPGAVLVDEGEVPTVDEAENPLILAEPSRRYEPFDPMQKLYSWVERELRESRDYQRFDDVKSIRLTPEGRKRLNAYLEQEGNKFLIRRGGQSEDDRENNSAEYAEDALAAQLYYEANVDYTFDDGNVVYLDPLTGRIRREMIWQNQLTNFIRIKEALKSDSQVLLPTPARIKNMITPQAYYAMMSDRLRLISATLQQDAGELESVYGLKVTQIARSPFTRPRRDWPFQCYVSREAKREAILTLALAKHEEGNAVVIITRSILQAGEYAKALSESTDAPVRLLTALNESDEAKIIGQAGRRIDGIAPITVATQMVGRGTDIRTDPDGKLTVISEEPGLNRSMDLQARYRAGRASQAESESFLIGSLDDDVFRFLPHTIVASLRADYKSHRMTRIPEDEAESLLQAAQAEAEALSRHHRTETLRLGTLLTAQGREFFSRLFAGEPGHVFLGRARNAWGSYLDDLMKARRRNPAYLSLAQDRFQAMMENLFPKAVSAAAADGRGIFTGALLGVLGVGSFLVRMPGHILVWAVATGIAVMAAALVAWRERIPLSRSPLHSA